MQVKIHELRAQRENMKQSRSELAGGFARAAIMHCTASYAKLFAIATRALIPAGMAAREQAKFSRAIQENDSAVNSLIARINDEAHLLHRSESLNIYRLRAEQIK